MEKSNEMLCVDFVIGNVSIGSLHGFEVPLYFEMPKQFLGDRLLSYAGFFKFSIEMKECKTELDRTILEKFPLIRIHSHDSIVLDYFGVSNMKKKHSNFIEIIKKLFISLDFFSRKYSTQIQIQHIKCDSLKLVGV